MSLLKKWASFSQSQTTNSDAERREVREVRQQNAENLSLVDLHWNNSKQIMGLDEKTVTDKEKCKILVYHLNEIVSVLVEEREDYPGACLKYILDENVFQVLYVWSTAESRGSTRDIIMRSEQIKIYRNLIDRCRSPVLLYEEIWEPLLFLLHSCANGVPAETEDDFVSLLKGLCVSVNREFALLDLFFLGNHRHTDIGSLSVFSLLIPYVHRDGNVGVWARDAVLLCMALSSVDQRLGKYILEKTNFCPVRKLILSFLSMFLLNELAYNTRVQFYEYLLQCLIKLVVQYQ